MWPLLEVVDECLDEPWLRSLAAHLGDEDDADRRARRFATVRHLAELFDRYALHRPGDGARLGARRGRRPRARPRGRRSCGGGCASGSAEPSPAERLEPACARLREDPALLDLPERSRCSA